MLPPAGARKQQRQPLVPWEVGSPSERPLRLQAPGTHASASLERHAFRFHTEKNEGEIHQAGAEPEQAGAEPEQGKEGTQGQRACVKEHRKRTANST
eukprot:1790102-Rhodomonas_salina.15